MSFSTTKIHLNFVPAKRDRNLTPHTGTLETPRQRVISSAEGFLYRDSVLKMRSTSFFPFGYDPKIDRLPVDANPFFRFPVSHVEGMRNHAAPGFHLGQNLGFKFQVHVGEEIKR